MASSLTTSGFRPPFWPYRVGTATQANTIGGGLFQDSDTFFDGDLPSMSSVEGGLFEDLDSLFHGSLSSVGQIDGSLVGDSIEVIDSVVSSDAMIQSNHTVTIPDGSSEIGRRVVVCVTANSNPAFSFPAGWTELANVNATDVSLGIAYRDIDGTEGFTGSNNSITVTTSQNRTTSHIAYLIKNFTGILQASITSNTSSTPDPNIITPSGGFDNYLFIALSCHNAGVTTTTGFPANYGNNQSTQAGDLIDGCGIAGAHLIKTTSSDDPGTFTLSQTRRWISATIALRSAEVAVEDDFFGGSVLGGFLEGSLLENTNILNGGNIYFGTRVSSSQLGISGTSENPGAYTLSQSQDWIACTVSIKGG